MKVIFAIILGWIVFKFDLWENIVEILFYVGAGWLLIKGYQVLKNSLKNDQD
jgi:hypothetical protein